MPTLKSFSSSLQREFHETFAVLVFFSTVTVGPAPPHLPPTLTRQPAPPPHANQPLPHTSPTLTASSLPRAQTNLYKCKVTRPPLTPFPIHFSSIPPLNPPTVSLSLCPPPPFQTPPQCRTLGNLSNAFQMPHGHYCAHLCSSLQP